MSDCIVFKHIPPSISQVLAEEGLNKYVDARYLQREIAEATDTTQADLDRAARQLMQQSRPNGQRQPYYKHHLGGYSAQEMKDFNQYSSASRPGEDYSDMVDDQMVYVTTL